MQHWLENAQAFVLLLAAFFVPNQAAALRVLMRCCGRAGLAAAKRGRVVCQLLPVQRAWVKALRGWLAIWLAGWLQGLLAAWLILQVLKVLPCHCA